MKKEKVLSHDDRPTHADGLLGLRNLFQLDRPRVDAWLFCDARHLPPSLIAREEDGVFTAVQAGLFDQIQRQIEG